MSILLKKRNEAKEKLALLKEQLDIKEAHTLIGDKLGLDKSTFSKKINGKERLIDVPFMEAVRDLLKQI